jgi:hypothetical protein
VTQTIGTAATFKGNDAVYATVTSTATCSTGKMVGGGANVSNPNVAKKVAVVLQSYPSGAAVWTATAVLVYVNGNGSPPSVTAYALCAQ